jgi:hypothetical protein
MKLRTVLGIVASCVALAAACGCASTAKSGDAKACCASCGEGCKCGGNGACCKK